MFKARTLIALLSCLALLVASTSALADPGKDKGKSNGNGHSNQSGKSKHSDGDDWGNGPSIDRGVIIGVLGGHRDYWTPTSSLPPGIQKNLARGKPLPPGIAKKLDGRLVGHLPRYEGYEWQQAGTDLLLVAIATGLIYEVVSGAFD
ncbi:hypothetical protein ACVW0Y_001177 [Pseudomonas sp. TE3786]